MRRNRLRFRIHYGLLVVQQQQQHQEARGHLCVPVAHHCVGHLRGVDSPIAELLRLGVRAQHATRRHVLEREALAPETRM